MVSERPTDELINSTRGSEKYERNISHPRDRLSDKPTPHHTKAAALEDNQTGNFKKWCAVRTRMC